MMRMKQLCSTNTVQGVDGAVLVGGPRPLVRQNNFFYICLRLPNPLNKLLQGSKTQFVYFF